MHSAFHFDDHISVPGLVEYLRPPFLGSFLFWSDGLCVHHFCISWSTILRAGVPAVLGG